jgi:hypothetical protein
VPPSPSALRASLSISGKASQASRRAKSASGWKSTPQALPWRKAWTSVCAERARVLGAVGEVEGVAVPVQNCCARCQMLGVPVRFVDVHRAAHRHGASHFVVIGQRLARQGFDGVDRQPLAGVEDPVGRLPGTCWIASRVGRSSVDMGDPG